MNLRTRLVIAIVGACALTVSAEAQNNGAADSPFQVRYAANLNVGEPVVNITNTGASGGNICVNIYVFAPDEQLVACCSCVVTPNGLVWLSPRSDLTGPSLTPAVPTSIVMKLLATTGETCHPANPGALAAGMAAWGTTIHAAAGGGFATTETAFTKATLSEAELLRMTFLCAFIQANGSGYGICRSCRFGGMGAVKR